MRGPEQFTTVPMIFVEGITSSVERNVFTFFTLKSDFCQSDKNLEVLTMLSAGIRCKLSIKDISSLSSHLSHESYAVTAVP